MENPNEMFNKAVATCIVGLLSWNIWTTQKLSIEMAVVTQRIVQLDSSIQTSSANRYTANEAKADQALADSKIERLETWVSNLSRRLSELENDVRDVRKSTPHP